MKILFLLLIPTLLFSQDFNLNNFLNELNARQSRVEEFNYIKEIATDLGIKHVYMFGGTAAAWGHYVRWDMRRELGVEKLQPQRFDYDYTNIFRANQDFDVVIDGTVKQAEALESAVQKHFNYFSGTRPTWEVRLLNEQRADKDPIMGDDFQNQHTDSHSTGLIEMMDCEGFDCIKDVRDINNPRSAFLNDLYEAKLHYYYSDKHRSTKRFKAGMNPEILSIVRYFTKAVQYELERRPEDIKKLQKMINDFKPASRSNWDGYVLRWLEKNAKKLIVNAVDMEFAQDLLEKTGLKKKLISLGDKTNVDSMAWWLSKQSLQSYRVGRGDGEKASELFSANEDGNIIVAHETNSFSGFESITKSHSGKANVLISRKNVEGEEAAYGWGHYTQLGKYGARGTGLTIRYILDPNSREGTDFKLVDNYVIIRNRNALTVIYESADMTIIDYFRKVFLEIEYDYGDRGVLEKIKRRVLRKRYLIKNSDKVEIFKIANKALDEIIGHKMKSLWDENKVINRLTTVMQTLEKFELKNEFLDQHFDKISFWAMKNIRQGLYVDVVSKLLKENSLLDRFKTPSVVSRLNKKYLPSIKNAKSLRKEIQGLINLQKFDLLIPYFQSLEGEYDMLVRGRFDLAINDTYYHLKESSQADFRSIVDEWTEWKIKDIKDFDYLTNPKKLLSNHIIDSVQNRYIEKAMIKKLSRYSLSKLRQLEKRIFIESNKEETARIWTEVIRKSSIPEVSLSKFPYAEQGLFDFDKVNKFENKFNTIAHRLKHLGYCAVIAFCSKEILEWGTSFEPGASEGIVVVPTALIGIGTILYNLQLIIEKTPAMQSSYFRGLKAIYKKLPKFLSVKLGKITDVVFDDDKVRATGTFVLKNFSYINLEVQIDRSDINFKLVPRGNVLLKISDYEKETKRFFQINNCNKHYIATRSKI